MSEEDKHLEEQYEDRFPEPELTDEQQWAHEMRDDEMYPPDEDEDEDYEPDPDVEFRKQVLNEVMERHPDMAFTGDSVRDYIYNDGELESAGIEDPMAGEW